MHIASLIHCQKSTCLWIIFLAEMLVADGQLKYSIWAETWQEASLDSRERHARLPILACLLAGCMSAALHMCKMVIVRTEWEWVFSALCTVFSLVNTKQMLASIAYIVVEKNMFYQSPFLMPTLYNSGFKGTTDVTCISWFWLFCINIKHS